jgi:hypothetical protein
MKIYYPEDYSFISVFRNGDKIPLLRFIFDEESDTELFTHPEGIKYDSPDFKLNFKVVSIEKYDDGPRPTHLQGVEDSIIIKMVNVENPEHIIHVDLFIQDFFVAMLLSQTLKTPLFAFTPSDDVQSLQITKIKLDDIKITVHPPEKRSTEYKTIMKALNILTKDKEAEEEATIPVPMRTVESIRGEILNLITLLVKGETKALIEASNYVDKFDKLFAKLHTTTISGLSEEEKGLLFLKDLLISLENDTHPITLSGVLTNSETEAMEYIENVLEFEKIMEKNQVDEEPFNIKTVTKNPTLTVEDAVAFLNSSIEHTPEPLATIIAQADLKYLWEYNWANPAEDNLDIKTLARPGDFLVSLMLAIASRLAKMEIVYNKLDLSPHAHPTAILISGLTSVGESFRWAGKQTLRRALSGNTQLLKDFIHITTNDDEPLNGALGMLLHGLGHIVVDEELTLNQIKFLLSNSKSLIAFLTVVDSSRKAIKISPTLLELAGEAACFIPSLLLSIANNENFEIREEKIDEIISAVVLTAETIIMKKTQAAIGSKEWNEELDKYVDSFVR